MKIIGIDDEKKKKIKIDRRKLTIISIVAFIGQ